jgi:uncharacterized membrane protein
MRVIAGATPIIWAILAAACYGLLRQAFGSSELDSAVAWMSFIVAAVPVAGLWVWLVKESLFK